MSIEFRPKMSTVVNDDTLYEFLYQQIYDDADGSLGKIIADKYDNDMGDYFHQYQQKNGPQPLSYWVSAFNDFGNVKMVEGGAYPLFHVLKDGTFVMELTLIAKSPHESVNVQMSSTNAKTIFQVLNLDNSAGMGSISPLALLRKIESVKGSRMLEEFTRPDENESRTFGDGIDVNYLNYMLMQLEALADFCIRKECEISWD